MKENLMASVELLLQEKMLDIMNVVLHFSLYMSIYIMQLLLSTTVTSML